MKPRLEKNAGLPPRWSLRRSAFYYSVPPGLEPDWDGKKLYRLGSSIEAATQEWNRKTGTDTGDIRSTGREAYTKKLREWGLGPAEHEAILRRQNGACRLCLRKFKSIKPYPNQSRTFVVDHCHDAEAAGALVIRGYLCQNCNKAEGLLRATGVNLSDWADRCVRLRRVKAGERVTAAQLESDNPPGEPSKHEGDTGLAGEHLRPLGHVSGL